MEHDFAFPDLLGGVYPEARIAIAAAHVLLATPSVALDSLTDDVPEEPARPCRVELDDVIGRALVSFRIKNRTGKVDVEKEDLTGVVGAEIEPRVSFAFESCKEISCRAPQTVLKFRIVHRDIALRMMLLDF